MAHKALGKTVVTVAYFLLLMKLRASMEAPGKNLKLSWHRPLIILGAGLRLAAGVRSQPSFYNKDCKYYLTHLLPTCLGVPPSLPHGFKTDQLARLTRMFLSPAFGGKLLESCHCGFSPNSLQKQTPVTSMWSQGLGWVWLPRP